MELVTELVNANQLGFYIPVVVVLVVAILVFALGFKHAEQPPFDKLSSGISDDRKPAGKKRKIKEKKNTANGHIAHISESKSEKSPVKESKRSPAKEVPETPKQTKEKKQDTNASKQVNKKNEPNKPKKQDSLEEAKNKKNLKSKANEKPLDYDEGDWEKVPSKSDKKKKQDSPVKKEKKTNNKKIEKSVEIDKLVKDEVNKELREKVKDTKIEINVQIETNKVIEPPEVVAVEQVAVIEEKKEKKKEKKPKKEVVEKIEKIEKPPVKKPEKVIEVTDEIVPPKKTEREPAPAKDGGVAFDEIGDVWEEPKAAKKSKKKARRDN